MKGKNMLCIIYTFSCVSHLSLIIHVAASWDKANMYGIAAYIQPKKAVVVVISILFMGRGVKYLVIFGSWSSQSPAIITCTNTSNSIIRNF